MLIELTETRTDKKILVNSDHIIRIEKEGISSIITTTPFTINTFECDGEFRSKIVVLETPRQIQDLILSERLMLQERLNRV